MKMLRWPRTLQALATTGALTLLLLCFPARVVAGVCGNNVTEPGEACDGTDLKGFLCPTVAAGFTSGTLSCKPDCSNFDVSVCLSEGKTIQATSCNQVDVQNAINIALDGDRVLIPEGNCSWGSDNFVDNLAVVLNKGIILEGAGVDKTTITANGGLQSVAIQAGTGEGRPWRITGFTLLRGPDYGDTDSRLIGVGGAANHWRIDHMRFEGKWAVQLDGKYVHNIDNAIGTVSESHGLIDNCTFLGNASVNIMGDPYSIPDNDPRRSAHRPISLGTSEAVYIEDSHFNSFNRGVENSVAATDAYIGGRYVFRYNRGRTYSDNHPGTFSYEIYENELSGAPVLFWFVTLRGGTGVVFNNRFSLDGAYMAEAINLRNDRSWPSKGLPCNGSDPLDGNQVEDSGTHSGGRSATLNASGKNWESNFWQLCTVRNTTDGSWARVDSNTGNLLTATLRDGADNSWDTGDRYTLSCGYPCLDQIGRAKNFTLDSIHPQMFEPIYEWNNTVDGRDIDFVPFGEWFQNKHHLFENRDFYNDVDKRTLGYTPYVYPHPLQNLVPTVGDVVGTGAVCGNGTIETTGAQVRDVIVVDNVDPGCVITGTTLRSLNWPYPYNGDDFIFALSADAKAVYTPDVPIAGTYGVYLQKPGFETVVHDKNGDHFIDTHTVTNISGWSYLGEFEFDAGTTGTITVNADPGWTSFDAVKLVRVGEGEECDDGNSINGDGCNVQCLIETGNGKYALGLTKSGTGTGVITSEPAGINCGADCTEEYWPNTPVKLYAESDPGSVFKGWSGACSGLISTCTVTMSSIRSVVAKFDIDSAPEIFQQPQNSSSLRGQPGGFYLLARGSGLLRFQWYHNGAPIDGLINPGATTYYYIDPSIQPADVGTYFCRVSNHVGFVDSNFVTMAMVDDGPKITQQPQNAFVYPGVAASFTISAEGSGPLNYQWKRDGVDIPGATGLLTLYQPRTYTTFRTSLADSGAKFTCFVWNDFGSVMSSTATLLVGEKPGGPSISQQPENAAVELGEKATFTVGAVGNPTLSYQWFKNSTTEIPGAVDSTYTTPPMMRADIGSTYSCMVSNAISSVTSNAATLSLRAVGSAGDATGSARFVDFRNIFNPTLEPLLIRYEITDLAGVKIVVIDRTGRESRVLDQGTNIFGNTFEVIWDGKNKNGEFVASGAYTLELKHGETSSRQKILVVK
jgi:cysteine-rich repeat protein